MPRTPSLIAQGVATGGVCSLLVASGPLLPLAAAALVVAGAVALRPSQEPPEHAPGPSRPPMFTPEEEEALRAFAARLDAAPDDAARRAIGEEWLPSR